MERMDDQYSRLVCLFLRLKTLSHPTVRCISRQLYWGHRIPAYLVSIKGRTAPDSNKQDSWVVGRTREEAFEAAKAKFKDVNPADLTLDQDEDVLDTWFSSGLFPFSVFGWPETTPDLKKYYPTTLLETGSGIHMQKQYTSNLR